jgi:hypothetical protein
MNWKTAAIIAFPIPIALLIGTYVAVWAVASDRIAEYLYQLEEEDDGRH